MFGYEDDDSVETIETEMEKLLNMLDNADLDYKVKKGNDSDSVVVDTGVVFEFDESGNLISVKPK